MKIKVGLLAIGLTVSLSFMGCTARQNTLSQNPPQQSQPAGETKKEPAAPPAVEEPKKDTQPVAATPAPNTPVSNTPVVSPSTPPPNPTPAPTPAPAPAPTPAPAPIPTPTPGTYTDGVFKGSALGYDDGITSVKVTVVGGKITAIEVTSHEDTPQIATKAFEQLTARVISTQKLDVDTVSGATYSSKGFLGAVKKALGK